MSAEEKIEGIKKIDSKAVKPVVELPEDLERVAPNKDHFDSLMSQQTQTKEATTAQEVEPTTNKPSLIDHISDMHQKEVTLGAKVSPPELVAQTQEALTQIKTIKEKLQVPNVEIKSSTQNLLQNKLTHINESLQIALSKTGSEFKGPEAAKKVTNPIERFLGFLSDGQAQLETLGQEIQQWHLRQGEISPATMLAVQIKVGYVQQELEFFTSLLNKALESTKTIMNVQV